MPAEGRVYEVELSRDWVSLGAGLEARYAGIRGAGEWARVVVELREVLVLTEGETTMHTDTAGGKR
jgi:hypothetical protein